MIALVILTLPLLTTQAPPPPTGSQPTLRSPSTKWEKFPIAELNKDSQLAIPDPTTKILGLTSTTKERDFNSDGALPKLHDWISVNIRLWTVGTPIQPYKLWLEVADVAVREFFETPPRPVDCTASQNGWKMDETVVANGCYYDFKADWEKVAQNAHFKIGVGDNFSGEWGFTNMVTQYDGCSPPIHYYTKQFQSQIYSSGDTKGKDKDKKDKKGKKGKDKGKTCEILLRETNNNKGIEASLANGMYDDCNDDCLYSWFHPLEVRWKWERGCKFCKHNGKWKSVDPKNSKDCKDGEDMLTKRNEQCGWAEDGNPKLMKYNASTADIDLSEGEEALDVPVKPIQPNVPVKVASVGVVGGGIASSAIGGDGAAASTAASLALLAQSCSTEGVKEQGESLNWILHPFSFIHVTKDEEETNSVVGAFIFLAFIYLLHFMVCVVLKCIKRMSLLGALIKCRWIAFEFSAIRFVFPSLIVNSASLVFNQRYGTGHAVFGCVILGLSLLFLILLGGLLVHCVHKQKFVYQGYWMTPAGRDITDLRQDKKHEELRFCIPNKFLRGAYWWPHYVVTNFFISLVSPLNERHYCYLWYIVEFLFTWTQCMIGVSPLGCNRILVAMLSLIGLQTVLTIVWRPYISNIQTVIVCFRLILLSAVEFFNVLGVHSVLHLPHLVHIVLSWLLTVVMILEITYTGLCFMQKQYLKRRLLKIDDELDQVEDEQYWEESAWNDDYDDPWADTAAAGGEEYGEGYEDVTAEADNMDEGED